jgi:SAM-dependent methyltransferase
MSVHRSARGFDSAADVYDRVRPGYTPEAVEWLVETLGLGRAGAVAVDLAAGTGKLTAPLSAHCRVAAVEPSPAMLALLRERAPSAEALEGTAEAIPLPDASADAVVVAQAFHWFAHEAALAEIHRALKPRGRLALVWNRRDLSAPAHAAIEDLLARYKGDTPRHRDVDWRGTIERSGLFDPLAATELPNLQRLPRGGLAQRVASTSFIAALPDDERAAVLDEAAAIEARLPDPLELPHVTELHAFRRRA